MALTFLDNLSFPAARIALNAIFNALDTSNAGATEPTDFQAFTLWLDTSGATPVLKIRNAANSAWINALAYQGDDASLAPWLIDEDDMASDLATKVPSQQSVKAFAETLKAAKNVVINGGMSVDQRNSGASQTITAGAAKAYTVDCWYAYCTGANVTGQQVLSSDSTKYLYQFTGAASNTVIQFGQRIIADNSRHLAGETVTLSADIANSLLTTVTWTAYYANTTDTFGTIASPTRTQIATGTFTVSATEAKYSTQIAIPAAATTGIEIVFSVANQTSGTWTIGNAQLELGAVATDFERIPFEQNLSRCRFYTQYIGAGSSGMEETATTFSLNFIFPEMYGDPALTLLLASFSLRVPSLPLDRTVNGVSIIATGVTLRGGWVLFGNSAGGNVAGRFIQERNGSSILLAKCEL